MEKNMETSTDERLRFRVLEYAALTAGLGRRRCC